jgi:hypothetical protein
MATKARSGGGITSNKLRTSTNWKQEPVAHKASPAGANQQGQAVQFRKEPLIRKGKGYNPAPVPPTGIANARKGPANAGPGGMGRTIYGSGSQSPTPPAREMPKGRDTLSGFGPEATGKR